MKYFVVFVASVYLFSGIAIAGTCGSGGTICCSSVATTEQFECVAPADQGYKFQINRFGFEREDGTIIWVGSPVTFDASSASAGSAVGAYASGEALPYGTYVALRPEISGVTTVSASGATATTDGVSCSAANKSVDIIAEDPSLPLCAAAPASSECNAGNGFLRIRDTSAGRFTISESSSPTITFGFDIDSGVVFDISQPGVCTYIDVGSLDVTFTVQ